MDDVARALVVTSRIVAPDARTSELTAVYLDFLLGAQVPDGRSHNRRDPAGAWLDEPGTQDHWGRSLWALATAATHVTDPAVAGAALRGATVALAARSVHLRATAYAVLGAAAVLSADEGDVAARVFLTASRPVLPARSTGSWPWPEPRLSYANPVVPEAMIALGRVLGDPELVGRGLVLLRWLVDLQTARGHLSVVPVGGHGPGETLPAFDQQPIEVAALAEAAATAWRATHGREWLGVLEIAVAWFEGENDSATPLREVGTGGGRDGLERHGANENQGAESTLAWLATVQLWLDASGTVQAPSP
ncbi:Glycosyltransferase [Serinibacter arcticus]|uniref:Glycosyltransferase n=1 Tax=Serinibacter arcticus TaxID=1655435 RepID=A0A4Z1E0F0_9MICO|nr:Glycosyltransferase [Serinibacter arcticus]